MELKLSTTVDFSSMFGVSYSDLRGSQPLGWLVAGALV